MTIKDILNIKDNLTNQIVNLNLQNLNYDRFGIGCFSDEMETELNLLFQYEDFIDALINNYTFESTSTVSIDFVDLTYNCNSNYIPNIASIVNLQTSLYPITTSQIVFYNADMQPIVIGTDLIFGSYQNFLDYFYQTAQDNNGYEIKYVYIYINNTLSSFGTLEMIECTFPFEITTTTEWLSNCVKKVTVSTPTANNTLIEYTETITISQIPNCEDIPLTECEENLLNQLKRKLF